MPNIKSAKKMVKVIERRRLRNQTVRSAVRTAFKKATTAAGTTGTETNTVVLQAIRLADKAAAKGVLHKNKAARKKSRLMKRLAAAAK